jgi:hypothetical protein
VCLIALYSVGVRSCCAKVRNFSATPGGLSLCRRPRVTIHLLLSSSRHQRVTAAAAGRRAPGWNAAVEARPIWRNSFRNFTGTIMLPSCVHWTQQERSTEVNAAMIDVRRGLPSGRVVWARSRSRRFGRCGDQEQSMFARGMAGHAPNPVAPCRQSIGSGGWKRTGGLTLASTSGSGYSWHHDRCGPDRSNYSPSPNPFWLGPRSIVHFAFLGTLHGSSRSCLNLSPCSTWCEARQPPASQHSARI